MTVAVAMIVTVGISTGRIAGVKVAKEDDEEGEERTGTEKMGVSCGPGSDNGLAVTVAMTAVEETVRMERIMVAFSRWILFLSCVVVME